MNDLLILKFLNLYSGNVTDTECIANSINICFKVMPLKISRQSRVAIYYFVINLQNGFQWDIQGGMQGTGVRRRITKQCVV